MRRRLTHVAPLPVGKIFGILYAVFGLIFVPFFAIAALVGLFADAGNSGAGAAGMVVGMIVMAVLLPVMYGVMGFVGGILCAALYNLIARWVGGLEFQVEDVGPAAPEGSGQTT
ncbi:MAG TPA: hypothetical protein VK993_04370 [Chthoniobacterales bacterium]|nr:hypothetical protein [Chthoniobacterales bacterium]